MPKDRLTLKELSVVANCVKRLNDSHHSMSFIARRSGYSIGTICKARFLINCKPEAWAEVVNGNQSLGNAYSNYTGRTTTSF
jgi:hypothetical protein